jgi:hypothetical protein
MDRILTVVGTNYRTYGNGPASLLNRAASLVDEGSLTYNRSDGLVKQASAQLPGAPRTFIHKCHGGPDSVVTSREAYEIAMRFLHGTHRVKLWLDDALVLRGGDLVGRSEYWFGVCIKPRYLDFELFHQSPDAENCYGPFANDRLDDELPVLQEELRRPLAARGDKTTGWAGPDRLVWDGFIDAGAKHHPALRDWCSASICTSGSATPLGSDSRTTSSFASSTTCRPFWSLLCRCSCTRPNSTWESPT